MYFFFNTQPNNNRTIKTLKHDDNNDIGLNAHSSYASLKSITDDDADDVDCSTLSHPTHLHPQTPPKVQENRVVVEGFARDQRHKMEEEKKRIDEMGHQFVLLSRRLVEGHREKNNKRTKRNKVDFFMLLSSLLLLL